MYTSRIPKVLIICPCKAEKIKYVNFRFVANLSLCSREAMQTAATEGVNNYVTRQIRRNS
jgi:hypothetical protein